MRINNTLRAISLTKQHHRNPLSSVSPYTSSYAVASRQLEWHARLYTDISSRERVKRSPRQSIKVNYDDLVDTSSLRRTLEAHREANRASIIRKIDQDGQVKSLDIHPSIRVETFSQEQLKRISQKSNAEKFPGSRHVVLGENVSKRALRGNAYSFRPKEPTAQWLAAPDLPDHSRLPWLQRLPSPQLGSNRSARQRLSDEVQAFTNFMTPNPDEQRAVELAIQDLQYTLQDADSSTRFEIIGSRATGLAAPLSDLDINIVLKNGKRLDDVDDKDTALESFRSLYNTLRKMNVSQKTSVHHCFDPQFFLDQARIPVILGVHTPTGLDVQIQQTISSFNSMQYAKAFVNEFPALRSLFLVLKQMLVIRGLTNGSQGGITSYPLLNMVVASLKASQGLYPPNESDSHFLYFLDMFSAIDFAKIAISVTPFEYLSKLNPGNQPGMEHTIGMENDLPSRFDQTEISDIKSSASTSSKPRRSKRYAMQLIDPADPTNDLGKTVHRIKEIQDVFKAVKEAVHDAMAAWDSNTASSEDSQTTKSLLDCCLGADYRIFELERMTLRQYATGYNFETAKHDRDM